MRRLDERLQDIWYGGRKPGLVLRMLSAIYASVVRVRRAAYRRGLLAVRHVGVPVIVVGNVTVGGSGKTPLVIALVEYLRGQGWSPGVVSRGFGRRSRGQREVHPDTSPDEGGDEPVLIARRCRVHVVVDADRVAAAERAQALGCDIVVTDDGLQHYRLYRDLEIIVVDADRSYGNGKVLPAGPLREPSPRHPGGMSSSAIACMQITNGIDGQTGSLDGGIEWHFVLVGDTLAGVDGQTRPLQAMRGQRVHAIAGIGNPRRFFDHLRLAGLQPVEHAFADHYRYAIEDLLFPEKLPIVMTEKDWVKCSAFAPPDSWCLPVRADCSEEFFESVTRVLVTVPVGHG